MHGRRPAISDSSPPLRRGREDEATAPAHRRRAHTVLSAIEWNVQDATDRVLLDADERHRRRAVLTGEAGTELLLDLPHATVLHPGDGLVLEDGTVVQVVGKPEPLVEVTAGTEAELIRLAWHVGNRHTAMQVAGRALRIRRDHVLEDMLRSLGAQLQPIEAAFEPERGAYAHGHGHGHGHGQHHHD